MIDAKELRIGNWIETYMVMSSGDWFDKEGKRHGQNVITEPDIRQKQIDIKDLNIISGSSFATYRPIPLSPEVLIACGFKEIIPDVEWDLPDNSFYVVREYGTDYFRHYKTTIKSLHQLQNLFYALTSKEIEYDKKNN